MKEFLLLISFLLLSKYSPAQTFTIDDIPLKWKDFTVKEGFKHHPFSAKIMTNLPYTWEAKRKDNTIQLSIQSELKVDHERSWVKKEFMDKSTALQKQALLNHEKGHLIIGLIHHRKLQRLFSMHKFSKRPKQEIDSIYKSVMVNLDSENIRYDEETNHMNVAEKQKEWIDKLMNEFNSLYVDDKKISFDNKLVISIDQ